MYCIINAQNWPWTWSVICTVAQKLNSYFLFWINRTPIWPPEYRLYHACACDLVILTHGENPDITLTWFLRVLQNTFSEFTKMGQTCPTFSGPTCPMWWFEQDQLFSQGKRCLEKNQTCHCQENTNMKVITVGYIHIQLWKKNITRQFLLPIVTFDEVKHNFTRQIFRSASKWSEQHCMMD